MTSIEMEMKIYVLSCENNKETIKRCSCSKQNIHETVSSWWNSIVIIIKNGKSVIKL